MQLQQIQIFGVNRFFKIILSSKVKMLRLPFRAFEVSRSFIINVGVQMMQQSIFKT